MTRRPRHPRRAFTIVEMAMCTLLSALALVASMRVVGSVAKTRYRTAERQAGILLADGLMNEITLLPYKEPASAGIGPDAGDTAGTRSTYNDVDDFDGYSDAPPTDRGGTALPGFSGWSREVRVEYVQLFNPDAVDGSPSGMKRIIITVRHNGAAVVTRTSMRTMH